MSDKSMKPGGGGRFAELSAKLAREGVRNPGAIAAKVGREKYGQKQMTEWAVKGRERAAQT